MQLWCTAIENIRVDNDEKLWILVSQFRSNKNNATKDTEFYHLWRFYWLLQIFANLSWERQRVREVFRWEIELVKYKMLSETEALVGTPKLARSTECQWVNLTLDSFISNRFYIQWNLTLPKCLQFLPPRDFYTGFNSTIYISTLLNSHKERRNFRNILLVHWSTLHHQFMHSKSHM